MTEETSLGVTSSAIPDAGASQAGESPTPSQDTGLSSSADVNTQPVQGEQTTQQTEDDPLAGFPPEEELQAAVANKTPFAEMAARIKGAYETLKPQFSDISEKFKPFEPYADRFSSPEEVQQIVDLKDKLYGWERDPTTNQLVPATQSFAESLAQSAPETADFLAADLMNGMTRDPETGRESTRFDLALESVAQDPARKAAALKILGGVEPTSIAPTWQPTAEELAVVKPELQDIYKSLPYDEREELKLGSPEFINRQLEKEKFQQELIAQNQQAQEREARQQQQREQYLNTQAQEAGNKYVEQQFRQGFTDFANSIVERSKFIQPIDPQSEVARQMAPEQLTAMNQEIQKINTGVGKFVASVVAGLSHPDTAWVMADFLKDIGIEPKVIQEFDNARLELARNARDYGELNFRGSLGQNGNQNGHAGLGVLQSNANRALQNMKARGNLVAKPLMELMSKFFEMKAGSYNQTLNGVPQVRPHPSGTAYDPARETTQRQIDPSNIWNKDDIERLAYR